MNYRLYVYKTDELDFISVFQMASYSVNCSSEIVSLAHFNEQY